MDRIKKRQDEATSDETLKDLEESSKDEEAGRHDDSVSLDPDGTVQETDEPDDAGPM